MTESTETHTQLFRRGDGRWQVVMADDPTADGLLDAPADTAVEAVEEALSRGLWTPVYQGSDEEHSAIEIVDGDGARRMIPVEVDEVIDYEDRTETTYKLSFDINHDAYRAAVWTQSLPPGRNAGQLALTAPEHRWEGTARLLEIANEEIVRVGGFGEGVVAVEMWSDK